MFQKGMLARVFLQGMPNQVQWSPHSKGQDWAIWQFKLITVRSLDGCPSASCIDHVDSPTDGKRKITIFPQTSLELNGVLNSSKKQVLFHHHFRVLARVPGLSPYSFGVLFHHHFLVPARVRGLVSLLFWHPVPSSCPGSGWGSGACLPTFWRPVPSSFPGSG